MLHMMSMAMIFVGLEFEEGLEYCISMKKRWICGGVGIKLWWYTFLVYLRFHDHGHLNMEWNLPH